jgi:hypothetical protein
MNIERLDHFVLTVRDPDLNLVEAAVYEVRL